MDPRPQYRLNLEPAPVFYRKFAAGGTIEASELCSSVEPSQRAQNLSGAPRLNGEAYS